MRRRSFVAGLACAVCAACSHRSSPPADAGPPDAAAAAAPADSALEALREGYRCIDDGHVEVRGPGVQPTQIACSDDQVCIGGACAGLKIPDALGGGIIERGRLLRFTGRG